MSFSAQSLRKKKNPNFRGGNDRTPHHETCPAVMALLRGPHLWKCSFFSFVLWQIYTWMKRRRSETVEISHIGVRTELITYKLDLIEIAVLSLAAAYRCFVKKKRSCFILYFTVPFVLCTVSWICNASNSNYQCLLCLCSLLVSRLAC